MPYSDDHKKTVKAFCEEAAWLWSVIDEHEKTFFSSKERSELLNSVASNWFHLVERLFVESIYNQIYRLIDGGRDNLNAKKITSGLCWPNTTKTLLLQKVEKFAAFKTVVKKVRNKIVAHADFEIYTKQIQVETFDKQALDVFLSELQEFVNLIHRETFNDFYPINPVMIGDCHDLIKCLRGGVIFWELFDQDPLRYDEIISNHRFHQA